MSAILYLEGGATGADSKELQIRCREGFRKLLERCGYAGKMPRLRACGSRDSTFGVFKTGHVEKIANDYVAMWIDSEDVVSDPENTWAHLMSRDGWDKPLGATDDQVLLMTTCMETLVVADRKTLASYYDHHLQVTALPPLAALETRSRQDVQNALFHSTRNCGNAYAKGERSFGILAKLSPDVLGEFLPSFARTRRILKERL